MALCPSSILACRLRVTLLDELGNVADQPNNYWVSDNLISVGFTPDVEAGSEVTMRGGCDCIAATYRGPDLLKRYTLEIERGALEPGLESLMLGSTVILDGTNPIGIIDADQVTCSDEPPPWVAVEVWSYAWEGDAQAEEYAYVHWLWPKARFQKGQGTLGATDFARPTLNGITSSNPRWGEGPYGDAPAGEDVGDGPSAYWFTNEALPDAACAYGSVTPAS